MARSLKQENTTLKGQITAQKTAYSTLEETASENEKHMKTLFKDYKNKTCHEIDQLKEDLASAEEVQGQMNDLLTTLNKETGAENPEDLVKWVEERAIEYADEKTHHDAVRMFGELQVKYNLLTEEMNAYKEKIAPKQAKKQKGLSGQHRKEDCDAGVLRPFAANRCSAVSWANGLAQQCSRHWDKHDGGKTTHLCKTHHKLVNEEGQYTGSWGLYHQKRPTCWGDHGLKVQNEWKKMVGKPINYKLKSAPYEEQFAAMVAEVAEDVPRFDYPELVCGVCAPVEEDDEFSSDEEGADDEDVSTDEMEVSDDEDEEEVADEPVAPVQAVIVPHDAPEDFIAPVEEECPVETPVLELEKDLTLEEESEEEVSVDEDEEMPVECFSCSEEMPEGAAHYPFEQDEAYCYDCAQREMIAQGKQSNCLAASTDEDDDDQ